VAAIPNILVIVTDDHRGGVKPGVMPKTVKWLKSGGCEFTNAFTVTPICGPSRASTMTGLHNHNHAVWTNHHGRNLPQEKTMQRIFQEAGYRTALYGKFINEWKSETQVYLKPDPLYWDDFSFAEGSSCMYPQHRCQNGGWKKYNVNGMIKTIDEYPTTYIFNQFSRFLDAGTEPWYAYLCPPNPHKPYGIQDQFSNAPVGAWNGNPAVEENTPAKKADKPPYIRAANASLAKGKEVRKNQFRSLMSVDVMIDSIFRKLQSSGQLDNTLTFLLSDNGMLWAEHTWLNKAVPYHQAIRIPFLVRGPGFPAGTSSQELVANIDVAPTAYRAAGIDMPSGLDGRALQDGFTRGHILSQYFNAGGDLPTWASIVTPTAKYTEYYTDGGTEPPNVGPPDFTEYYDRELDPWELTNRKEPPPGKPFAAQLAIDRGASPPVPDGAI
jgi:arylsulfatase A-like enzyme